MKRKKPKSDELHAFLHAMPKVKKEAFVLLVRTKTKKDLKAMALTAFKEGTDELEQFYEAAVTLRTFVEAGFDLRNL